MSKRICPACAKPTPAGSPSGRCPTCLFSLALNPGPALEEQTSPTPFKYASDDRIGHYKLLEPAGEGGFGTVWMAEQTEPVRRRVALKILKLGMDTREVVARFEAERQALAMMDHPNIARVFDGGATENGRPYFVMELVRGVPITEFCNTEHLTTRERLELFILVCEAVQHAHQKGIIHRDLKPNNILVSEQDGRFVPKVIDFGVAKAIEEPLTEKTLVTRFHQFLGTPAYMSPEQAGLGGTDIDTRCDIYALGVLLYELLTGRAPFSIEELATAGLDEVLRTIREMEAPKPSAQLSRLAREDLTTIAAQRRVEPRKLNRLVHGELDWIAMKALEKDRSRRYQSANEFAADLRRYLDNEPIAARPPSNLYRLRKLARRNKALFGAASAALVTLVFGLVLASWFAVRATHNLSRARLNAYASEMTVAEQALTENNLERALQLLNRQRPKRGEDDLRGFEWRYLWQRCQGNETAIFPAAPRVGYYGCAVAFSGDGRLLAYSDREQVVVRDVKTQGILTNLPTPANTIDFSGDGRWLATARFKAGVVLWDTSSWAKARSLDNAGAPAIFSPVGPWLVTGSLQTNRLQLWNTETWEPVASCPQTPLLDGSLRSAVAFSSDGKLLVTPWMQVSKGGLAGLYLWKVPTLQKHADLFPPEIPLQSAGFLPDGKQLVTAGWLGHLLVWDIESNPPRIIHQAREHTTYVPALAVARGGKTFVTASADQSVCLWDALTFKRLSRWRGHRREVWAVAMSSDGSAVASSSPDNTVRLWTGRSRDLAESMNNAAGDVAGFTADGQTVVVAPSEGDYRWQLITGTNHIDIPIPAEPPLKFNFLRPYAVKGNEPIAALGRSKGQVEIWDLGARSLVASWNAGSQRITAAVFSPDGRKLATVDETGIVRIWETQTQSEIATFKVSSPVLKTIAFSPDGKLLAAGTSGSRKTPIWNIASREQVLSLPVSADQVAFSPDGKTLVTCSVLGNEAQLWELPSGGHKGSLKGHVGGMVEVTFSPNGKTLATGAYDGRIKLWNVAIGQEVATIPYAGMMTALRFSSDGRTLATSFWTSPGYRVELFRAPSFEEIEAAEKDGIRTPRP